MKIGKIGNTVSDNWIKIFNSPRIKKTLDKPCFSKIDLMFEFKMFKEACDFFENQLHISKKKFYDENTNIPPIKNLKNIKSKLKSK